MTTALQALEDLRAVCEQLVDDQREIIFSSEADPQAKERAKGSAAANHAVAAWIENAQAAGFSDAAEMQARLDQLQVAQAEALRYGQQLLALTNCMNAAGTGDPNAVQMFAEYTRRYLVPNTPIQ